MPKKAVLICNGSIDTKHLYSFISKDDFLIAVDGGANKLLKTKFTPSLIIGDMDSISKSALKKYRGIEALVFPREKDFLDLELAIDYCIRKKFAEIIVLGAMGSRADMTLANVFLLEKIPEKIGAKIIHANQEISLLRKSTSVEGIPGERISLFPMKGSVRGLTLEGLRYPLKNHSLEFGVGRGISNEFIKKKARISFKSGLLLCVHFREWF